MHLIAHVEVSVLGQQQWHQVHAALLCCQVNGADALTRHRVGVGTVLQQCGPNVHLVLLGSNVEWRVAVLWQPKETQGLNGLFFEFLWISQWIILSVWLYMSTNMWTSVYTPILLSYLALSHWGKKCHLLWSLWTNNWDFSWLNINTGKQLKRRKEYLIMEKNCPILDQNNTEIHFVVRSPVDSQNY